MKKRANNAKGYDFAHAAAGIWAQPRGLNDAGGGRMVSAPTKAVEIAGVRPYKGCLLRSPEVLP
ncbi:MAG: hypothetical protein RR956_05060 [Christensenella sp.]